MLQTSAGARLAVDIGGTFTDIVLLTGKRRLVSKLLTTPRAPEQAVIAGVRDILASAGLAFRDIAVFVHGTTLATNAIIERKGAKTALLTTQGSRDVIEIADEGRFDQYDINIVKPVPLVPRELRFTIPERMDVHGRVRLPLDEPAVRAAAGRLCELGIDAVAVAFIHAYANPAHELRVGEILAKVSPRLAVTLSSQACPEAREYERTSTAIANAYVQPLISGYLRRLKETMAELGYPHPIHLMTSGGNLASLETAARFPVRLVESGPAGGAILAGQLALERGERRILAFDMGGTTAKICLIDDAEPLKARTFELDRQSRFKKGSGMPVRIPVIEMVEIGAGGVRLRVWTPCSGFWWAPTAPVPSQGPPATGAVVARRRSPMPISSSVRSMRYASLAARSRLTPVWRKPPCSTVSGTSSLARRANRPRWASAKSSMRTWRMRRACMRSSAASPSANARWWPSAAPHPCMRAGLRKTWH